MPGTAGDHDMQRRQAPKTAILFPGEYNAYVGMLQGCRHMPVVQDMIEMATECFDFNVEQMMREGPQELMCRTDYSQMLAFIANCVAWEVLRQEHPEILRHPYTVAGFSVGEISALVAAGVISYDQGLIIVKERADAMQQWAEQEKMAAVGVFGLEEEDVERCMRASKRRDDGDGEEEDTPEVYISHYWGGLGFVCSGLRSTVMKLKMLLDSTEGAIVHLLEHTSVAAHTRMAEHISEQVEVLLADIPLEKPNCEIYFNTGYRVPGGQDPQIWYKYFATQLAEPVRWDGIIQSCILRGVQEFYECGPGESLKELMVFNVHSDVHREFRPYERTKNIKV